MIGLCAMLLPAVVSAQDRSPRIRRARIPIPNQYIVVLAGAEDATAVGMESETLYRGRLRHVFRRAVRGFAMRMTPAAAAALARDPRVAYVEEDGLVSASLLTESPAPWGLDRIDQRLLPLDGAFRYPAPIRQVRIHVLDTGVRVSHREFGGRAFNAGDFVDDNLDWDASNVGNDDGNPSAPDGDDCNGHGTHVAAIAAGETYGVAKQATVMSYRVLDCNGDGTISSVLAGVDAVTEDPFRPAVANMSLSGDISETLDAAVRRSIASGITYVVAAGNDAVDAATASPARVTEAITVAATGTNDARAGFSNYGSRVDLFAPGVSIHSAWYTSDTATALSSGTSMAAPHVTGVAALLLEQVPGAGPASVHSTLVNAATTGLVGSAGLGSPNRLLYSGMLGDEGGAPPSWVPAPWSTGDVGSVGADGSANYAGGTFTVDGSGADIWGTADAFRFVYQSLSGDGTIVAHVGGIQNVHAWSKAAVMMRAGLTAGAANVTMLVSAGKGLSFQRRAAAGGITTATLAPGTPPEWLKIARAGSRFSAYHSYNGSTWTLIGEATISMPQTLQVGLAVTSHAYGSVARGTFSDVQITATASTQEAETFQSMDIGATGGATVDNGNGTYALTGAGADIWGTADGFRYMYREAAGDFDVEARVASLEAVHAWTKAGVMIRESLMPGSRHAFALVSAGKGIALQYRASHGGSSAQAGLLSGTAPHWVKLSRRGSTITASRRTDGGSWQTIGSTTIAMPTSVYVGVAVTSHDATRPADAAVGSIKIY
ncbi:MAG: S8 family serine peptidase [Vicinamibacterales bacterium]